MSVFTICVYTHIRASVKGGKRKGDLFNECGPPSALVALATVGKSGENIWNRVKGEIYG